MSNGIARGLVAGHHQENEERAEFLVGQPLPVDFSIHQRAGEVVRRILPAGGTEIGHQFVQIATSGEEGIDHVVGISLRHVLLVGGAENNVGAREHRVVFGLRNAHHVADNFQREAGRHVGHKVSAALGDHFVDDFAGGDDHLILDRFEHPRREGRRHDLAQAGMAGIVHIDHRAKEVIHEVREVGDRRGSFTRAELLGILRDLDDVVVFRDGEIPRANRNQLTLNFRLGKKRERLLRPQPVERTLPLGQRPGPKLKIRQVDLINGEDVLEVHWGPR